MSHMDMCNMKSKVNALLATDADTKNEWNNQQKYKSQSQNYADCSNKQELINAILVTLKVYSIPN